MNNNNLNGGAGYSNYKKKSSIDLVNNSLNINDYNIIKQIGEGTFGKIFEVEDYNHHHFALKKLLANSVKEMEMLKSEYELLLGLEGLNINLIKMLLKWLLDSQMSINMPKINLKMKLINLPVKINFQEEH